jgi:hypothetical protein
MKKKTITLPLDENEIVFLNNAKEKSGIKNTTDLIRFLIKSYVSK